MEKEEVCYTREVALEKAVGMESDSFELYKQAYLKSKERQTRDLLRDLALDELRHKYALEKAFFEETVALYDSGFSQGPSMNLSILLKKEPLNADATVQDIMIYAIQEEKRAVDFYKNMAEQCSGAPMEGLFRNLYQDEEGHLALLEELYERVYLKEM